MCIRDRYYDIYEAGGFLKYGETLAQEYRFLNTIVLEFEQVNGYEEFLTSIEQKARQLSSISIFAESKSGYDMENILSLIHISSGLNNQLWRGVLVYD